MPNRFSVLLAEDDENDVTLLRRAFQDAGASPQLEVARDGQAAIEFLHKLAERPNAQAPALVLLDLNMPRRSGLQVLEWIRQHEALCDLPVIIFSASTLVEDVEPAYALGANSYIVKPSSTVHRTEIAAFINQWLVLHQPPLAVTHGPQEAKAFHARWARDRESERN
jgi:CheY-like chemotaxis protein